MTSSVFVVSEPGNRHTLEFRHCEEAIAGIPPEDCTLSRMREAVEKSLVDTGDGDDALAAYVARLDELKLIATPGTRASYSQSGYNLAGRIIEKVTGLSYENAIETLLLKPLGMANSFYSNSAIMTRRFAVGHNPDENGELAVARDWKTLA